MPKEQSYGPQIDLKPSYKTVLGPGIGHHSTELWGRHNGTFPPQLSPFFLSFLSPFSQSFLSAFCSTEISQSSKNLNLEKISFKLEFYCSAERIMQNFEIFTLFY
jgi:hypothetical protein